MKTVRLGDVCELITRGISPKYTEDRNLGVTVLNQKCIRNKTVLYEFSRLHNLSVKSVNKSKIVRSGDILVNSTGHGTLGRTALVEGIATTVLVDSHITILRPIEGLFEPRYFAYLIGQSEDDFINMATGTSGQTELPRALLNEYRVSYEPSIEKQRKIVARLDAAFEMTDHAISLTRKNIQYTRIFQEVSINLHLSTHIGSQVEKIADISDLTTDYVANGSFASLKENVTYKSDEDYAVLVRLIDHSRKFQGPFVYVNKHSYDFLKKSSLRPDDIIISNVGARLGTVFRAPNLDKKMTLGPNAILIRSEEYGDFLYVWLRSSVGQKAIKNLVGGAGQPKFNKTDFRNMTVQIPKDEASRNMLIDQILTIESDTDRLLRLYSNRIEKLEKLKSSLLAQAFSSKDKV